MYGQVIRIKNVLKVIVFLYRRCSLGLDKEVRQKYILGIILNIGFGIWNLVDFRY